MKSTSTNPITDWIRLHRNISDWRAVQHKGGWGGWGSHLSEDRDRRNGVRACSAYEDTPAPFAETAQRAAAPSIPSGHITVLVCTPVIYSRWFQDAKKQRRPFLCATRPGWGNPALPKAP